MTMSRRWQSTMSRESELVTFQPLAFYGFAPLGDSEQLSQLRADLLEVWRPAGALGRVYLARGGVNGQMIVPVQHLERFHSGTAERLGRAFAGSATALDDQFIMNVEPRTLTVAAEEIRPKTPKWKRNKLPFVKLDVRVRRELVATDGACDGVPLGLQYGTRLSPAEWHSRLLATFGAEPVAADENSSSSSSSSSSSALLIDMRNSYESSIGYFAGATRPPVDTFRDTFAYLEQRLEQAPVSDVYMYCTGGIRCEVVSAWLAHKMPQLCQRANVYKLDKGITGYVDWATQQQQPSLFYGHEYMFDDRISVKVTDDLIGSCATCGQPASQPTNCENPGCHVLFVQCPRCSAALHGCCSSHCMASLSISPTDHPELFRQYCKEAGRELHANRPGRRRGFAPLPPQLVEKYLAAREDGSLPPLNPELWPELQPQPDPTQIHLEQ